jgi:hypothetical protein
VAQPHRSTTVGAIAGGLETFDRPGSPRGESAALSSRPIARQSAGRDAAIWPTPQGIAIFDSSGHFAIVNARSDLPKFASNDRMNGTAEGNKAIVQGSLAIFGTYSVAAVVIIQHIEGGTWPSQNGTDQRRTIASFTGDDQTWTTAATLVGESRLHWKRLKCSVLYT